MNIVCHEMKKMFVKNNILSMFGNLLFCENKQNYIYFLCVPLISMRAIVCCITPTPFSTPHDRHASWAKTASSAHKTADCAMARADAPIRALPRTRTDNFYKFVRRIWLLEKDMW
jgi:hypothetical protein